MIIYEIISLPLAPACLLTVPQMYLALVLLATLHGLVFMPVALAVFGGDDAGAYQGAEGPGGAGGSAHGGLGFGFGEFGVRALPLTSLRSRLPLLFCKAPKSPHAVVSAYIREPVRRTSKAQRLAQRATSAVGFPGTGPCPSQATGAQTARGGALPCHPSRIFHSRAPRFLFAD